jgi:hypothetical protein
MIGYGSLASQQATKANSNLTIYGSAQLAAPASQGFITQASIQNGIKKYSLCITGLDVFGYRLKVDFF